MSDQLPDKTDSTSEYKRDLPFGVTTSFAVHITAAILLFSVVAAAVAVSDIKYPTKEQKSTIITIETLVRTPTTAAHQSQPTQQQVLARSAASSSSASSASSSPSHGARSTADPAPSTSGGVRTEIAKLASSLPRIKPAMSAVAHAFASTGAASAGSSSASGSNGSGGATNGQSTINGPGPGDVDNGGRGHTGPVWGEEQADGPFGHAHGDSCTPSRGGWYR